MKLRTAAIIGAAVLISAIGCSGGGGKVARKEANRDRFCLPQDPPGHKTRRKASFPTLPRKASPCASSRRIRMF